MDNRRRDRRIDMTDGPIMRNILLFALPLVLGNILQQLYTTVDTLVIGAFCGTTSLAAVGTSAQPVEVVLCVFLGLGTGTSILISQYIGAGNRNKTLEICRTSVAFVWVCGITVGGLGMLAAPAILRLMQVPEDTLPLATLYVRIVLAGSLGNIGYNMNAGILRGMGNSTASLAFLLPWLLPRPCSFPGDSASAISGSTIRSYPFRFSPCESAGSIFVPFSGSGCPSD